MLLNILDAKVEKTVGRGKNVTTVFVKKYKTHKDVYDRVVRSLAYYKNLLKEENGI